MFYKYIKMNFHFFLLINDIKSKYLILIFINHILLKSIQYVAQISIIWAFSYASKYIYSIKSSCAAYGMIRSFRVCNFFLSYPMHFFISFFFTRVMICTWSASAGSREPALRYCPLVSHRCLHGQHAHLSHCLTSFLTTFFINVDACPRNCIFPSILSL